MKKKIVLSFLGAALGMMLVGCGFKDSDSKMDSEEKVTETSDITQAAKEDDKVAETPEPTEDGEENDGSEETKGEAKYEVCVDKKIQIDGSQERFRILINPDYAYDVKMTVGKAAVKLDRVSINSRSSTTRVKVRDCTGDGKDDIVLMLYGGASGAYNEIQVLAEEKGKWKEVPFPEELWEEDFISFKKASKKMKITVPGTKEEKVVNDASDDEWGTRYRLCKIGKDGQITIVYQVYRGDDINHIVGKVKLTMRYDRAAKAFKIGKTTFSF
ncbi:MAG: hypothetical protein HFH62_03010 [Lachnospiraceae bacterium]|nr:hypothetical protein [Lachnospiraceae bacterium]